MDNLISSTKKAINYHSYVKLPFSIYSAYQEQRIKNVPIAKPLLIVILKGVKELGSRGDIECFSGSFIFLSNSSSIDM